MSETEDTDTDYEEPKRRVVRKEAKRTMKTLQKIDEALQSTQAVNPYLRMLSKWK